MGYDRSAEYVAARLKEAGYDVRFEEFTFPFFEDLTPPVLSAGNAAESPRDLRTLRNSGSGNVTAPLRAIDLGLSDGAAPAASTSGCEVADFAGFPRGAIALVRRGTCTFQVKADLATAAGAAGVIIMNEGTQGRIDAFGGQLNSATIPVVGIAYETGRTLVTLTARADPGLVHLTVDAVSGTRATRNVLAEPKDGLGGGESIVVGAHLDSVPEGPGINDNGSGSAAVLDAATRLAGLTQPATRRVQFAFWGAEEEGLLGSRHHMAALSADERRAIRLYINLDMVGSPNFARFVQGTQGGDQAFAATASRLLVDGFRTRGLTVEERTRAGGRGFSTDDSSFAQAGVATVGPYTGASEAKSAPTAATFGGTAGAPYDACYHKACDTIANIDRTVLGQMTDVLTETLVELTRPVSR